MEGNLYDMITSSELLEQSCDLVTKTEDEEPAPCWKFSNLSSFHGDDFTLSNTQKQTLNPFPSNLTQDHCNSNYAVPDMKNWCATPPKRGLQRLMQLNLSPDYTFRSGLDFSITKSKLGMSNMNNDAQSSPVTSVVYNNMDGLETHMKPLKSDSMSTGDDIGYNVSTFRRQLRSLEKSASKFPAAKTQSQHHQRTSGKVQSKDSKRTICHDAVFKRPRLYNLTPPSKVKFGDRVTALQQLVSPFGKTDAASVLFVTIAYIKLLHEQVQVLSAPYMESKDSCKWDRKCWGICDMKKETTGSRQDLKSKGLCLVPLSYTPNENTSATAYHW